MFERFDTPVRCAQGHLFTTIWVPMASLKSARLGGRRWQHCPVGHHWGVVEPLDAGVETPETMAEAAAVHDVRIP